MIVVIGAGKFGTAIGVSFARNGHEVALLSRKDASYCVEANKSDFLMSYEDVLKPTTLSISNEASVLEKASAVVLAVPTQQLPYALELYAPYLKNIPLLLLQKGIIIQTQQLPFELARNYSSLPISVLAGPNFADEIVYEEPSITAIACENIEVANYWASLLESPNLSIYVGKDVIGTQIASAIKNIVAIVAGVSDGLNFGANTLAAVITRGMQEATALGLAMGAKQETFLGPAGIGDFTLTCNSSKSRNYKFGKAFASGRKIDLALETVEGAHTVFAIKALSDHHRIEMPLCSSVKELIEEKITPKEIMKFLMYQSSFNASSSKK